MLVDRDGTINEEISPDYLLQADQVRLIPGAARALRELRELGLGIVVVTNQSPVGRGWITTARLDEIHERLSRLLEREGAAVGGYYACPHAPDEGCECRKPAVALALQAAAEHGFDPARAFVVGDHRSDVEMGRRIGARTSRCVPATAWTRSRRPGARRPRGRRPRRGGADHPRRARGGGTVNAGRVRAYLEDSRDRRAGPPGRAPRTSRALPRSS